MRVMALWLGLTGLLSAGEVETGKRVWKGVDYQVVRLAPERIELVWKGPDGRPMRTFERVLAELAASGKRARFLMNAGIFEPGGIPSGLHVEGGKILHPLNRDPGEGNFYLKPNGVFGVTKGGRAKVVETDAARPEEFRIAVQSGPMLLIGGKRHPAFGEKSPSRKHRNGVGIDAGGRVVFAMTEWPQRVNLWDFAGLFLELGCRDALFLDGDISRMEADPKPREKREAFGAMFLVSEPAE